MRYSGGAAPLAEKWTAAVMVPEALVVAPLGAALVVAALAVAVVVCPAVARELALLAQAPMPHLTVLGVQPQQPCLPKALLKDRLQMLPCRR